MHTLQDRKSDEFFTLLPGAKFINEVCLGLVDLFGDGIAVFLNTFIKLPMSEKCLCLIDYYIG